jgi:murein DD-endopeptidase MepM/ murein hydrolase activator NlpD
MENRRFAVGGSCLLLLVGAGCAGGHRSPAQARTVPTRTAVAETDSSGTAPQRTGVYHVVQAGQTLWRIAVAYDVPLDELTEANGIADPSRVAVGQRLLIPGVIETLEIAPYESPAPVAAGWIWPVGAGRVLSPFGAARKTHRHHGLDIGGRSGQPVIAARAGRVVYSGAGMRGYGKTVILDHGEGIRSLYAHNSSLLVRVGQKVDGGQSIAKLGRTGNATTHHCHFEIRRNDVPVDPLLYVRPRSGGS